MFQRSIRFALACVTATLAACGGADATTAVSADLTVAINHSAITIVPATPSELEITVTRLRGFADTVALDVDNLPSGLTATFAPAKMANDVTTSVLTIAVTGSLVPGTTTVLVRASGKNAEPATTPLDITIGGPLTGGFTLTAVQQNVSIIRGQSGTMSMELERTDGFEGAVLLRVSGLPINVTALLAPSVVTGNNSTLTLNVGPTVPTTTYLFTVTAEAGGLPGQTITLTLLVSPAPGGSEP